MKLPRITSLHFAFLLTGTVTTLLGAIAPAAQSSWKIDDSQFGALFAAQFLASLLTSLLSGILLRAIGSRAVIVAGVALMFAGTALLAFSPWPALVFAVAIYGAGIGLTVPTGNLIVGITAADRRTVELNLLNFFWTFGAVLGPPVLLKAISRVGTPLTLAALSALILFVAIASSTQRNFSAQQDERMSAPPATAFTALIALALFLYVGAENAFSGWLLSSFWMAMLIGRLSIPSLAAALSNTRLLLATAAVALLGTLLTLTSRQHPFFTTGILLLGLGLAPIFATVVAIYTERLGLSTSASLGPVFATSALGGAALPWLVGLISHRTSSIATALLVPAAALVLILSLIPLFARAPQAQRFSAH